MNIFKRTHLFAATFRCQWQAWSIDPLVWLFEPIEISHRILWQDKVFDTVDTLIAKDANGKLRLYLSKAVEQRQTSVLWQLILAVMPKGRN